MAILAKMVYLTKRVEMAINRQIVKIPHWDGKGSHLKAAILAKIAKMANNRQIVNKISNDMAKDPF